MVVIVAGTRTIRDYNFVVEGIYESGWVAYLRQVVSGASEEDVQKYLAGKKEANVDILGAVWAQKNGIDVRFFPADWPKFGNSAGPIRNAWMADHAEALILIWTGNRETSKGSASMWNIAHSRGLKRFQHIYKGV